MPSSLPFRSLCSKLRQAIKALSDEDRAKLGSLGRFNAGQPVSASDFLSLCMRVGLDPVTGEPATPISQPMVFSFDQLRAGYIIARITNGQSVRKAAKAAKVTPAALTRIEQGRVLSAENVLAICKFIGVSPLHYMANEKREAA